MLLSKNTKFKEFDLIRKQAIRIQPNILKYKFTLPDIGGLEDKTIMFIGDSITEHNFRARANYDEYFGKKYGATIINAGVSGTGYMQQNGEGVEGWLARVDSFPYAEYIFVMGSLNDSNKPLGCINDYDNASLFGCMNLFYASLQKKYPNAHIAIITATPRSNMNAKNKNKIQYINAVIDIAKKYNIAYFDLFSYSSLKPWNFIDNIKYFSCKKSPLGDGVHPNELGQKIMFEKLEIFILQQIK